MQESELREKNEKYRSYKMTSISGVSVSRSTPVRLFIHGKRFLYAFSFSAALQPKSGLRCLVLKFQDLSHTHTHTVGPILNGDQPFLMVATYTTRNKHKRRDSN